MNGLSALGEFIALDFETTGLFPADDEIIDIGAVHFRDGEEIARFATLVNPERNLPPEISQLTGITDAMLASAPTMDKIKDDFRAFLDDFPIMAHNIKFEMSFLKQLFGLQFQPATLDSYDVFALMFPMASSHSLEALIRSFGIRSFEHHRGLQDALDMVELLKMCDAKLDDERFASLCGIVEYWLGGVKSKQNRSEISAISQQKLTFETQPKIIIEDSLPQLLWSWYPFFQNRHQNSKRELRNFKKFYAGNEKSEVASSLENAPKSLGNSEFFRKHFERFQIRASQQTMAEKATHVLKKGGFYVAEAGTGIGKTLAYTSAAFSALAENSDTPIVISTHTKMLQNQFLEQEFPRLKQLFNAPDLKAVALKGMNNYVCVKKIEELFPHDDRLFGGSAEQFFAAAFLENWLLETKEGEVEELPRPLWELPVIASAHEKGRADNYDCLRRNCEHLEQCFYFKKEWEAESAHILTVNHSLLLKYPRAYPQFSRMIVDEADELYAEALDAFSHTVSFRETNEILRQTTGEHGILRRLIFAFQYAGIPQKEGENLPGVDDVAMFNVRLANTLDRLNTTMRTLYVGEVFSLQFAMSDETKAQFLRDKIFEEAQNLQVLSAELIKMAHKIEKKCAVNAVQQQLRTKSKNFEEEIRELRLRLESFGKMKLALDEFLAMDELKAAIYCKIEKDNWELVVAPFNIGEIFQSEILGKLDSAVFTSATISPKKDLSDFVENIGLNLTEKPIILDRFLSPFDYKTNSRLFFLKGFPNNQSPTFPTKSAELLGEVAQFFGGRTLALFTSKDRLKKTHEILLPILQKCGIELISHGVTNNSLLRCVEHFKNTERAVLLGTRGMWKGVDIPGESLQCLVVEKMPYSVPNPYTRGLQNQLAEKFRDIALERGEEPTNERLKQQAWNAVDKPQMFQSFRQIFGRLIRTETDRGVMIVLDAQLQGNGLSSRHQELVDLLPNVPTQLVFPDQLLREIEKFGGF